MIWERRSLSSRNQYCLEGGSEDCRETSEVFHEREAIATKDLQQAESDLLRVQEEVRT